MNGDVRPEILEVFNVFRTKVMLSELFSASCAGRPGFVIAECCPIHRELKAIDGRLPECLRRLGLSIGEGVGCTAPSWWVQHGFPHTEHGRFRFGPLHHRIPMNRLIERLGQAVYLLPGGHLPQHKVASQIFYILRGIAADGVDLNPEQAEFVISLLGDIIAEQVEVAPDTTKGLYLRLERVVSLVQGFANK